MIADEGEGGGEEATNLSLSLFPARYLSIQITNGNPKTG